MFDQDPVVGLTDLFNKVAEFDKEQRAEKIRQTNLQSYYPSLHGKAKGLVGHFPTTLEKGDDSEQQRTYQTPEFLYNYGSREIKMVLIASGLYTRKHERRINIVELFEVVRDAPREERRLFMFDERSLGTWDSLSA